MLAINNVPLEDTFAEAFPMTAARLIVTAELEAWALTAGQVATGYASSVIGCDAEDRCSWKQAIVMICHESQGR